VARVTLPESLADLPQPLYFFDGYCVLCSGFVQFCFEHDGDRQLKFASAQSPLGARVLDALGLPAGTLDRTILLVEHDAVFSQSTAVLRALDHLRGWPRWLLPLRRVPRFIRDPIYDLVARHRYRWFGRRSACFVPTAETRARFIDL
jgi:predicted DCC family thiol-disulfide oxidoreductase YuxK